MFTKILEYFAFILVVVLIIQYYNSRNSIQVANYEIRLKHYQDFIDTNIQCNGKPIGLYTVSKNFEENEIPIYSVIDDISFLVIISNLNCYECNIDIVTKLKLMAKENHKKVIVLVKDCDDYRLARRLYPKEFLISMSHWHNVGGLNRSTPFICHLNKNGNILGICSLKLSEDIITHYFDCAINYYLVSASKKNKKSGSQVKIMFTKLSRLKYFHLFR